MKRQSSTPLFIYVGSILVLFAGLTVGMWRVGLVDFTGTAPSSNLVASALALVGTFFGAVISLIGALLKHSIDRRTESREWEAEQRQKLEAAVRAIQLFSTNEGSPAPEIQRDGALFALSSLGQHELTLQLADSLLAKGQLNVGVATGLMDQAIRHGSRLVKEQAVLLLEENASSMLTSSGIQIPQCIANWDVDLDDNTREWVYVALARIMLARPASEWSRKYSDAANGLIAPLCLAWNQETVPWLKGNVGAILSQVIAAFPKKGTIFHPCKKIDMASIRKDVAKASATTATVANVVQQLTKWAVLVKPKRRPGK